MARQFIAGKDPRRRHENAAQEAQTERIGFTVDLLGEAVVSEQEANEYAARCFELLEALRARPAAGPIRSARTPSFSRS